MDLSKIYPPRPANVHKGNYGSVLVVCGSKIYSGAGALASVSALRSGADLVVLCSPERSANIAAHTQVDLITLPLKGEYLSSRHVTDIADIARIRRITSMVIGCGLGRNASTIEAVYRLITRTNVPLVLDADALFAISQKPEIVHGKQVILTPHLGELMILLGQNQPGAADRVHDDFEERIALAKQAASKYYAVVLLKGPVDVVTDGRTTITNNTGSPFMTKGGFGDTLAGIVGALLGRGVGMIEAAHVGAYINGKAGEQAANKSGEGVAATDIFEFIPKVIKSV